MEKLLHERLREWACKTCPSNSAFNEYDIDEPSIDSEEAALFNAMADEIERYYIPRPRFEDGEPVQGFDKDERISYYYVYDDGSWVLRFIKEDGSDYDEINGKAGEPVKLPTPKVYDADGVECKEYEWVWDEAGNEWEILPRPADAEEGKVWAHNPDGVHKYLDASNLTHREPDSLKRLLNDIREYLATSPVIDSHAREWEKRFAALIERCA